MKMEDLLLYMIDNYINNEIEYIEESIQEEEKLVYYDTTGEKEDLKYLESLTWEDKNNILENITYNTDLYTTIYDTIQEYLYKYKNEKKEQK